jgi:hypothetical protein
MGLSGRNYTIAGRRHYEKQTLKRSVFVLAVAFGGEAANTDKRGKGIVKKTKSVCCLNALLEDEERSC